MNFAECDRTITGYTSARKHGYETEFAAFVRNHTTTAIALTVPLGRAEQEPTMSDEDFARLRDRVRDEVSAPIAEVDTLIEGDTTVAPHTYQEPTTFDDSY